jgi:hypothetical protein
VALWITGAAIAGLTAPFAVVRDGAGSGAVFGVVAVALAGLALATARVARWALVVSIVGLAGQLFGALGSAWELVHGVSATKATELRTLGIDPTVGVAINLAYSALAFGVFVWALARARISAKNALPSPRPDGHALDKRGASRLGS